MACMLVALAFLACTANALELKRGEATPQPALPFAVPSLSLARKHQETVLDTVGPIAWDSNTVGVRLPDNWPSPAWGADKVKAVGSDGLTGKDFAAGRFFSGGTDGKTQAHGLAALGYFGNKFGRPDVQGLMAAGKADQQGVDVVAAVPREDSDGIGLDYARTRATVRKGHILPGQLHAAQLATPVAVSMEKDISKVKSNDASAPAAAEEESYNKTESEILMKNFMKDFNDYQVKLMILDFPYQSALWFAAMRGWCHHPEHPLPAAEEAQKVKALDGQYQVIKDNELAENVGKIMTIKDGKLFRLGLSVMDTSLKAYVDHKYATVTPLKFPVDNSTVELYKIFMVNGNRLEFEGGNIWQREQAQAPAASSQPKAADWLQKLVSARRK